MLNDSEAKVAMLLTNYSMNYTEHLVVHPAPTYATHSDAAAEAHVYHDWFYNDPDAQARDAEEVESILEALNIPDDS
jgi:hypothetical protein